LSRSAIELLIAYGRTRVPLWVYLPLAVFLWVASLPMDIVAVMDLPDHASGIAFAFSLAVQFRLWDDLADVEEDRKVHPERVLVRAGSLAPFYVVLVILITGNDVWVYFHPVSWVTGALFLGQPGPWRGAGMVGPLVFLLLNYGFLVWYQWLRRSFREPLVRAHVVLIKYPVFVYLLAMPWAPNAVTLSPSPVWPAWNLAVVYLTFCCYEVLHDDRLRTVPVAGPVLAMELIVLGLLGIPRLVVCGWVFPAVLFGSGIVLVALFRLRREASPGAWPYVIFLVTFLWMAIPLLPRGFLP
jgi:hypothetical protein